MRTSTVSLESAEEPDVTGRDVRDIPHRLPSPARTRAGSFAAWVLTGRTTRVSAGDGFRRVTKRGTCVLGQSFTYTCRRDGTRFGARQGGGFWFDLLHCEACGRDQSVSHEQLGDIHLGFVKGLPGPYAMTRWAFDREVQRTFAGPTLSRDEYHAAAEATLEPCLCGGRFRYDAPARCPTCRSTAEEWDHDSTAPTVHYD